ncbi:MAG: MBL fold metallo-hydrolase [Bacteroidota bacterium]
MTSEFGGIASLGEEIRASRPATGQIFLWWLGQAGWVIKSAEATILIDPYLGPSLPDFQRLFPAPVKAEELTKVDYLFITHQHLDHYDPDSVPKIMKASPHCRLVVESGCVKLAGIARYPQNRVLGVERGEGGRNQYHQYPEVSFRAIRAYHNDLFDQELGYFYVGYVIRIGGITLWHTGDTQYHDTLAKEAGRVDLLLVPINGKWGNMNCQSAVTLAKEASPRLAIPMHWGMIAENTWDPNDFVTGLKAEAPQIASLVPEVGGRIVFS